MAAKGTRGKGSVEEGFRRLREGDLQPVYLLCGRDRYFLRKGVAILKERVLPDPGLEEMLFHRLYGGETAAEEIVDLAQSMPFFDQRRLIVVWNAERIPSKGMEVLGRYARDPAPFTVLILLAAEKYEKKGFFRDLREALPEGCLEFPSLSRRETVRWLERMAREKGLEGRLEPGSFDELLSGGRSVDLEGLENHLEILSLYWQEGDGEAPSSLPPSLQPDPAYLLTDALLEGKRGPLLVHLGRLVDQGTPPLLLFSRICWEIRRIWTVKSLLERGGDVDGYLRRAFVPTFKKGRYISKARGAPWDSLRRAFSLLGEVDRRLKLSRLDPRYHLEELCDRLLELTSEP